MNAVALTDQATRLLQNKDYAGAERLARQAVAALQGSGETYEAYAEYDLGAALVSSDAATRRCRTSTGPRHSRASAGRSSRARRVCRKSGEATTDAYDERHADPRHRRGRLHRLELRPLLARAAPRRPVVALDLLTYAGNRANLDGVEVPFVQADIADLDIVENVLREHEIDVVVNFAAESHNSLAVIDPGRFFHTNVLGTQALLEAARRTGVERFHHVSTCEVYGDLPLDSDESFTEESPYRPRTPYNASKAGGDHAVRAYFETWDLPITITNCSNNYGPFQFPEKVIPLFVTNALDDRPLPMYASTQNRREWLHVRDHCRAIELALEQGAPGETYNVGSAVEASIEEIADRVLELTGKPESLKTIVPDRPGHDRRYLLDSSKIGRELGWEPEIGFEDGLRDTVEWYAANRAWWEPLKERLQVEETAWRLTDLAFPALSGVRHRTCPLRRGGLHLCAAVLHEWDSALRTGWRLTLDMAFRDGQGRLGGPRASGAAQGLLARCAGPSSPAAGPGGRAPRS